MIALAGMRLTGFFRGGRALAPLIAVLVVLGVLYGGGASPAATAYGYSAAALFPILAWLTKVLLDTEPDVQRRLARLAVGPVREGAAGLLAALVAGAAVCAVAMVVPLLFHGIRGPEAGSTESSLGVGIALGVLAHLLSLVAAAALGAVAGRAVTRRVLPGVAVLVTGSILAIVLGLTSSFAPWLVPPVMATARALNAGATPATGTLVQLTAWSLAWSAVALTTYGFLRRARS
ncbi:hypothetical protein GCM10010168_10880 [Actinoplanes ianthinogenes]|uniref:Integral membrane protein n=1 Tax=Actinoplanes ianthinogenes TaxID=122358 RepID=A0ABM7LY86_9ACTN|nr:hypothetical protein [Actinoplanes ianthinogenes]BCJ44275.1 hypothetical protein Aiant_49320 [Actinoplanes ianthinogenes]GGQ96978.1 hypothetical protein GCM10010168_10880 [Actinoplanes ianthinogenes]